MTTHTFDPVLITGATSGIGFELANEFARRGHPLVVVGPVEPEIRTLAGRLSHEHHVPVTPLAADLRNQTAADELYARLTALGVPCNILVVNAGPFRRDALDFSLADEIASMRAAVDSGLHLARRVLPALHERGSGRVLIAAAASAFAPAPVQAACAAVRIDVVSAAESLADSLGRSGVTVTAFCHAAADTVSIPVGIEGQTPGFSTVASAAPAPASDIVDSFIRGDRIINPGVSTPATIIESVA